MCWWVFAWHRSGGLHKTGGVACAVHGRPASRQRGSAAVPCGRWCSGMQPTPAVCSSAAAAAPSAAAAAPSHWGPAPALLFAPGTHRTAGWLRQLSPMAGRFSCRRSSLPPTMWLLTSTTVKVGDGGPGTRGGNSKVGRGIEAQQPCQACRAVQARQTMGQPPRHPPSRLTSIAGRRKALEAQRRCRQQRVPLAVLPAAKDGRDEG